MAANIQGSRPSTVRLIALLEEYGYVGSAYYEKGEAGGRKNCRDDFLEMVGLHPDSRSIPSYQSEILPECRRFIGVVETRSEALVKKVRHCLKTYVPQLPAEFIVVPGNGEAEEVAE
jgi:hypothetical protein